MRHLVDTGIELCNSNNSRADVRESVRHQGADLPGEWRERALQQASDIITTHPSWLSLPDDTIVLAEETTPSTSQQPTQEEQMKLLVAQLVAEQVKAMMRGNTTGTPSSSTTSNERQTGRPTKLPDVGKFNGNRRAYRTFKSQMTDKLASLEDRTTIGVAYMFNRLEGQAAHVGLSWKERNPHGTTEDFWAFLDEQYKDSLFEERSRQKLQSISMKKFNQSLESFNAEFIQLAYDAAEENNTRNLKTRYMSAIRQDLQEKMVSVDIPEEWDLQTLMARVSKVDVNMRRTKGHNPGNFGKKKAPGEEMDWEPTKAHAGQMEPEGRRRAKWVPQEVINKRLENHQCVRCGEEGHYAQRCKLKPPKRPGNIQARGAAPSNTEETPDEEASDSEN